MNAPAREHVLVNVGCGPLESAALPPYFEGWRQVRVDIDPAVGPDIIADLTDLSAIEDRSADVVWAAHCVEHLYEHQVPRALREFRRILRDDGFICVIVPDLQTIAHYVAADRLHETMYDSAAGPVRAHDVLFGYGAAIAKGRTSMAHRCGFTPTMMQNAFEGVPYGELLLHRRDATLELMAVARATPSRDETERRALLGSLGL